MPVPIHGKEYATVAERIDKIKTDHPEWSIETQLIHHDDNSVIMKALIMDGERLIATGYAEEVRGSTNINATSAMENAETSSVGRAAAFAGYPGTEIRSADEMQSAVDQQQLIAAQVRGIRIGKAMKEHEGTITAIQDALAVDNLSAAKEAWDELSDDEKKLLWVAPSKGGCFTTREREVMKSTEFREA